MAMARFARLLARQVAGGGLWEVRGAASAGCVSGATALRLGLAEKLVPTRPHSATVFQNAFGLSTYARGNPDGYCGTTILCVQKGGETVLIGDGQVTAGHEVIKHHVRKVRRIGESGVIGGFAGSTADALTLYERLENKLEEYPGQLRRASVELAKAWRTEKYLRRLDAVMIVADKDCMLEITGNGDVIEPDHGVLAVGSGGTYAFAAARALLDVEGLTADDIARKAMEIAADICIYTNDKFTVERLPQPEGEEEDSGGEGPQEG